MLDRRLALAACLLLAGACSTPAFNVEANYAQLEPKGDLKIAANGANTGSNDLDSVGIDGSEGALGLRADFDWLLPHLTVTTQQKAKWDGSGTLDADISEGGVTIPAGTAVNSELEFAVHKAVVTFDLMPTQTFELGLGLGVSALDFDATVRDPGSNAKVHTDEMVPLPVLAARAGVDVWRFDLEALVAGIAYNSGGDDIQYLDFDFNARLDLFGMGVARGELVIGYRYIEVDAKYENSNDDIHADLEFTGPYFGLGVSF